MGMTLDSFPMSCYSEMPLQNVWKALQEVGVIGVWEAPNEEGIQWGYSIKQTH